MMKEAEIDIDFDCTNPNIADSMNGYFQSSFARLMALQNNSQCKSLDSSFLRNDLHDSDTICDYMPGCVPIVANISKSANVSSAKSYAESFKNRALTSNKNDQVRQERRNEINSVKATETMDPTAVDEEISKLRAECQSLSEENKKLHLLSLQNSNVSLLQSQLESLQWQLKQTESSRQMYRAVMEQVSKFLERVHKNLDIISSKMSTFPKTKMSRFPRSRSVHTMAGMSVSSSNGGSSRCSSPSPTHFSSTLVSNLSQITSDSSTIEQINDLNAASAHDSLENTFKEYTWKPSRPAPEHVTLEKLSQESFRFYRTVQSLLNIREPDLIHRLTPAVSEVTLPDANEKIDNNSVGSCISLFQNGSLGNRKSVDMSSSCSTQFTLPDESENMPIKTDNSCIKPACVVEDESGFSSMSSFHDVNILPEMKTYPKLGLPIINCEEPKHRRWTSTPVDKMYDSNVSINFCNSNEILPVLWV